MDIPGTDTLTQPLPTPAEVDLLDVEVVIPVYNEERCLADSVERLDRYLAAELPYTYRITIADNASTDGTWAVARRLADDSATVAAVHLAEKGRGRALHRAWSASPATVLAYMDVDLSTDLSAVLPLVAPLLSGHSDVAIGTRLSRQSRVVRGPKREFVSRAYNLLLRTAMRARFSDAQCGFKAIRSDRAAELLPLVADQEWFFDTELLILAERAGLRIHEVPVDWTDDPDSRVDIVDTARKDLRGMWRLGRGLATGTIDVRRIGSAREAEEAAQVPPGLVAQLAVFVVIGLASTVAYAGLFWLLRWGLDAYWANGLALLLTAIGNTAANRRFTFNVRGADRRLTHQAQGLVVFALGLAVTSAAIALLNWLDPGASRLVELTVLIGASAAATAVRFILYRSWLFPGHRTTAVSREGESA